MKIVVIDINNLIYRAFYGIQQPLKAPNGQLVNAVYGVFNMIHRLMIDHKPEMVLIAKDSRTSLRKTEYADYKKSRSKMPDDLRGQIDLIYEMLGLLKFQMIEVEGYEADDIINSVAISGKGSEVLIVSTDKDLMQLVNDHVKVIDTMKQKIYATASDVEEKMGVPPCSIVDFLALLGDTSDDIPGVPGIGEKTAIKLIKQYGSVSGLLAQLETLPEGKLKSTLTTNKDLALVSYSLASLKKVELPEFAPYQFGEADLAPLKEYFEKLNMKSSLSKLSQLLK